MNVQDIDNLINIKAVNWKEILKQFVLEHQVKSKIYI